MPVLTQALYPSTFLTFGDNMKCVITGHTSGIGQALMIHFVEKGWTVYGLSRSNGYDIDQDLDKIIEVAKGCDLFINNAYSTDSQLKLTKALIHQVPKIVTMGAAVTDYPDLIDSDYSRNKKALETYCRVMSLQESVADVLFLKISFAETTLNRPKTGRIDSDFTVSYKEIADTIDFWLTNPKIRQIDFRVKLTSYTLKSLMSIVGSDNVNTYLSDLFLTSS